jgi:phosphatidyl-myo-inositol dimannoside synthase
MPPRCLIVTQCFYPDVGGIEGLMTDLAGQCMKAGYEVTVFADRIRQRPAAPVPPKPYPIARFGGPRPWRRWRKRLALAACIEQQGEGIAGIFADSWKSVEALPDKLDIPVSVLAHGMEFPASASPNKGNRIEAALKRCSAVIANSAYTASLVAPFLGAEAKKIRVVHPPIAPLPEPDPAGRAEIERALGGRRPILASIARLEPRKGIDTVIRAMPELLRHFPECVYAIAGAGPDRPRLEALAKAEGVENATLFMGRVSDQVKPALLARADLFAMPVRREGSSVEGFGISYLEAGWFAVPSVAGREGGAADAVLDGETGLVCNGSDLGAVTNSLLLLLQDDALRSRLGAAAQRRIKQELSWEAAIGRYLDGFESHN